MTKVKYILVVHVPDCFTHWYWSKMSAILQMTIWNAFSWKEKFLFWLNILLKFNSRVPVDNMSAVGYVMALHRTADLIMIYNSLLVIMANPNHALVLAIEH